MLVPSSFKYSSAAMDHAARKPSRRSSPTPPYPERKRSAATLHSVSPPRNNTDPVSIPLSSAPNVAAPKHIESESNQNMATKRSATVNISRRKPSSHDPNALPPAVAALLAVTAIPPRRPNRYRTHAGSGRRISIEELISEWRNDDSLKQSYESPTSGALGILLEDGLDADDDNSVPSYLNARSASSDSMPSLDSDNQSVLSVGSPSTPGSLRSRKSITNFKKEKPRSLPASVDCALDHPLITTLEIEGDDDLPPLPKQKRVVAKSKSSFKSNLTASLQSLKEAAVNSISSLGRTGGMPSLSRAAAPPMDDMLWSHPFLFPRFSSEVRPAYDGTPTQAHRRYLNPMPLTFEEQEAPFQEALHAPFLAETVDDAPIIQMQTYNRGRKRPGKRAASNPSSEAGRALLGQVGGRQREVRENSNFLRVVVLEMNMRREGKLEQGRAKIWLPPRESSATPEQKGGIPKRWIGESA
ncbi:hypothetical protein CB0940_02784 [Cercospora beticola]|uniref:Uncharacterized protein n=1 Tax=Cercospora beticola TaxID=122368 RepID=A0A2G5I581_CERBT|nr:hypothetical protein CB0940_02784 [Cercospora beticola]PIA99652.1 hypothetical protein CB0940_02784 [Cercospora beticola]WPA99932.1 hypothetical protein RHO25_004552 [Cercospora beticola]CAK1361895.1 unnamed protein product [Cercospora beticola]